MSQSKFHRIYPLLLWGGFMLWIFFLLFESYPFLHTPDTRSYIGEYGNITDWHSPWMCFKLGHLFRFCESINLSFGQFVNLIGVYYSLLLIAANGLICYILKARKKAALAFVGILLLSFYFDFDYIHVRPDHILFAQLAVIFSLIYLSWQRKLQNRILVVVCLLFLFDTMTWRQQSLLLIPVFIYYILKAYPRFTSRSYKWKLCCTGVISLAFLVGDYVLKYRALDAYRSYPQSIMMLSDIRNTSELSKRDFFEHLSLEVKPVLLDGTKETLSGVVAQAYWFMPLDPDLARQTPMITRHLPYQEIEECWFTAMREEPEAFMVGRVMSYSQFLFCGRDVAPIEALVKYYYPHIRTNKLHYYPMGEDSTVYSSVKVFLLAVFRAVAYLWILIAPLLLWKKTHCFRKHHLDASRWSWIISSVYLISYIPFTPTPDARFLGMIFHFSYLSMILYGMQYKRTCSVIKSS